jgi:YD repeat-containing protein
VLHLPAGEKTALTKLLVEKKSKLETLTQTRSYTLDAADNLTAVRTPNGKGWGWEDSKGDVWCPTGQGGSAHGGPHWDVQTPGGGHRNVRPKR